MELTPNEELALVVLLWKFYRSMEYRGDGKVVSTCSESGNHSLKVMNHNLQIADKAIKMSERLGVKKEYIQLMLEVPVTTIVFTEKDEWEKHLRITEALSTGVNRITSEQRTTLKKKENASRRKKKNTA